MNENENESETDSITIVLWKQALSFACFQLHLKHNYQLEETAQLQNRVITASLMKSKRLFTISVRKAISFSRLDRWEKCLSFSNSCERWCLITEGEICEPRAASTSKHSSNVWVITCWQRHVPVEIPCESSCGQKRKVLLQQIQLYGWQTAMTCRSTLHTHRASLTMMDGDLDK